MSLTVTVDAFLADYAKVTNDKLDAMGVGPSTLHSYGFPAIHPALYICLLVGVPYGELGTDHKVDIRLVDEDGQSQRITQIVQPDGTIVGPDAIRVDLSFPSSFGPDSSEVSQHALPVVIPVHNISLSKAGRMEWVIELDGEPVKRLPMSVKLVPQPM